MRATRPGESALFLLDVIDLVSGHKIHYAVIGALAAAVHGSVRASLDADVVLSAGLSETRPLRETLASAGFQVDFIVGDADDPIPALVKVTDSLGNQVDLLIGLKGLEPEAFSRAMEVTFQGKTLKFVGREDFIAMKAFAGGPLDLVDASRAIAAGGAAVDLELVRRLCKGFGKQASDALERLLKA